MKIPPLEMNLNKKGNAILVILFLSPLLYGIMEMNSFENRLESLISWKYEKIAFSLCLAFICLIWLFPRVADYFAKDKEKKWMTILAAKYLSLLLAMIILLLYVCTA